MSSSLFDASMTDTIITLVMWLQVPPSYSVLYIYTIPYIWHLQHNSPSTHTVSLIHVCFVFWSTENWCWHHSQISQTCHQHRCVPGWWYKTFVSDVAERPLKKVFAAQYQHIEKTLAPSCPHPVHRTPIQTFLFNACL